MDEAPILHLHVGPHKTASTFLQQEFSSQRDRLRLQGVVYPHVGAEFPWGHHNIAWHIAGRRLHNTSAEALSRDLALFADEGNARVLMSSEEFMGLSETGLGTLRRSFGRYSFRILYVRRDDLGLIVSLWQELVKHGFTVPLDKVTPDHMRRGLGYDPLEHASNIEKLETGLEGPAIVFDYEDLKSPEDNVLRAFGNALGVTLAAPGRRVNARLPFGITELIRAGNIHAATLGLHRSALPRKATFAVLESEFGHELRQHVKEQAIAVAVPSNADVFVQAGFPASVAESGVAVDQLLYVPGRILYEALDRHDIRPWQMVKERILAGITGADTQRSRSMLQRVRGLVRRDARG